MSTQARELSPADVASLDLSRVRGFVTELGGTTSHAAIVARADADFAAGRFRPLSTDADRRALLAEALAKLRARSSTQWKTAALKSSRPSPCPPARRPRQSVRESVEACFQSSS